MKKIFLLLAITFALIACNKEANDRTDEERDNYFSKVKRYTDGRTPPVDTVWTLQLFTQAMVDSFAQYDGYLYSQTSTYREVGVLWWK